MFEYRWALRWRVGELHARTRGVHCWYIKVLCGPGRRGVDIDAETMVVWGPSLRGIEGGRSMEMWGRMYTLWVLSSR